MPEANYYGVIPNNVKDVENRYRYAATASQTTFVANYAPGFVDVYYGGLKLDPGAAFTATNGTSIVLTSPATAGVIVEIICKRQVQVLNSGLDSFATVVPFTATAGQTSFSMSYIAGSVMLVTRNGLDVAFTATNGTSVVLTVAASVSDVVKVYVTMRFNVANAVPSSGGVMTGTLTLSAGGTSVTQAVSDNSSNLATTGFVQSMFSQGVTGLNDGALAGFRNLLINGDMRVSQYGTVSLVNNVPTYGGCDRWYSTLGGTTGSGTIAQTTSLQGVTQSGMGQRAVVTTTGLTSFTQQQRIERRNTMGLNGKTLIVSGKVYQSTGSTQTMSISLDKAASLDNFGSVSSLNSTFKNVNNAAWTPFSLYVTLGSNDADNGLAVTLQFFGMGGLTGAIFMFGDLQYEVTSLANPISTPLEQRPYGAEVLLCRRFARPIDVGTLLIANATTGGFMPMVFDSPMRIAPAILAGSGTTTIFQSGSFTSTSTPTIGTATINGATVNMVGFTGLTSGSPYAITGNPATQHMLYSEL